MGDLEGHFCSHRRAGGCSTLTHRGRLADAGARVIKVERPEGDFARCYDELVNGGSAYFVWLNRGKQSIRLDLKDEGDRALLGRMVEKADVFIQNLAPGSRRPIGIRGIGAA